MNYLELTKACDAREVIKKIGYPYREKNGYTQILCPGHYSRLGKKDENYGNCIVNENGYYCFACGEYVKTRDMIKEICDCDNSEAYHIMAETIGADINDAGSKPVHNYFSPSTVEAALLPPVDTLDPDYFKKMFENACKMKTIIIEIEKQYAFKESDGAIEIYELLGEEYDVSVFKKIQEELRSRRETIEMIISTCKYELR